MKPEDIEFRILMHENVHAKRKDKFTAILGASFNLYPIKIMLYSLMGIFAVYAIMSLNVMPFLVVFGLFVIVLLCHMYEEIIAGRAAANSSQIIELDLGE